jgi:hypothetical protein
MVHLDPHPNPSLGQIDAVVLHSIKLACTHAVTGMTRGPMWYNNTDAMII